MDIKNGAPNLKGATMLANTYAACLELSAFRIFWAICAITSKNVFGAESANDFTASPPMKSPLFYKVDAAFRNMYLKTRGTNLPNNTYVQVKHATLGHLEAP